MVTPSSGPAAANPAGSKARDEPRPAMPGGGVFERGGGLCGVTSWMCGCTEPPLQLFEKSCTKKLPIN